ncbi:MAG TPA: hypothetical protein VJ739_16085, partial [Gemmataceae bacterium]|nr:hypothetical protein [Gemmataceae bacterium]
VVTAVEKGLWVLPLVGRSTSVLRLALERWADEAAAGETETQREAVRRALESLAESPPTGAAVAAFTGADTVLERLSALRDGPPRPSLCQHTAAYLPGCFLFAGAGLVLSLSGGAAHAVLTLAAHCPT